MLKLQSAIVNSHSSNLYAQDPELFIHTWYLQKIVLDDGTEHVPVFNDDVPYIGLTFYDEISYYFETTVCNTFYGELNYQSNNIFLIIFSDQSLLDCLPAESYYFEGIQFGFFSDGGDHIVDPFLYDITQNGNDKTLTITNVRGDDAIYGNQLLSIDQYDNVKFSLFPNPVQGTLNINQNSYQFVNATIYDMQGKKINRHTLQNNHSTIDLKAFTPGLYFLVLESESGEKAAQKFVKK
jgi:hypothetical protein